MSHHVRRPRGRRTSAALLLVLAVASLEVLGAPAPAGALAPDAVLLGTADNFGVLAGQGVTNTGPTTVTGDLGTSPNPAVTGAGLTVLGGAIHAADAVAASLSAALVSPPSPLSPLSPPPSSSPSSSSSSPSSCCAKLSR